MKFDDNFTQKPKSSIGTGWMAINMNPDELEKMRKELEEIMKASLQGPWKHSGMSFSTARNTSPSATDAHYPYQEPELRIYGTVRYGLRITHRGIKGLALKVRDGVQGYNPTILDTSIRQRTLLKPMI